MDTLEALYRAHARSMDGGECGTTWESCFCDTARQIRKLLRRTPRTSSQAAMIRDLVALLAPLADDWHAKCRASGYYEHPTTGAELDPADPYHVIVKLALMAGEGHEAIDAVRWPDWRTRPDKKVPDFTELEIELADKLVRFLDLTAWLGLTERVIRAAFAKHDYNSGARVAEHGKRWGKSA